MTKYPISRHHSLYWQESQEQHNLDFHKLYVATHLPEIFTHFISYQNDVICHYGPMDNHVNQLFVGCFHTIELMEIS